MADRYYQANPQAIAVLLRHLADMIEAGEARCDLSLLFENSPDRERRPGHLKTHGITWKLSGASIGQLPDHIEAMIRP